MGMYIGKNRVIEAKSEEGVVLSSLESWKREKNYHAYYFEELTSREKELEEYALSLIGSPYNRYFLKENKGYYCSELIQDIVNKISESEIIPYEEMSFEDENQRISRFWIDYYEGSGYEIPNREDGSHPTLIASNNLIKKRWILTESQEENKNIVEIRV